MADIGAGLKLEVKQGDRVSVEYTGTFADGTVFDRSGEGKPLELTAGGGQMIKGFDRAVLGMNLNETKKFNLKPEEAYGPRDERLSIKLPRDSKTEREKPEPNMMVALQLKDGRTLQGVITKVTDTEVSVDLNHLMAGRELV